MSRGQRRRKRRSPRGNAAPPTPASIRAPLSAPGSTRVEKRLAKARRRRRITLVATAALALVAVVIAVFAVNRAVTGDPKPTVTIRTQRTLLLQVRGRDNLARSAVLLAHDPADRRSSMLFVPPSVLAQAPGLGTVPFEEALRLGGPAASRGAVSDLLGVTVDDDWTMTEVGFIALVDRLGRLRVDVDVEVIATAPDGRKVRLISPGGGQELDGTQALAYATYQAPGEDQLGVVPRLQEVLEALLEKVRTAPELAPILQAGTRAAPSSLAPTALAGFVTGVAESRRTERIAYATLPVIQIDTGAPRPRYRLDEVPALELVHRTLSASVPEGRFDGDKRVIIQNGVGAPGLTASAQQRLTATGFDIVKTGNANRFDYARSVILVKDTSAASTALGTQVAKVLALSPTLIRVNPQRNTVTDVIVILGRDYKR
ncbi:MAG TPA: LCP family protein [Mycobacteriales bacterium]|nr:LCP family protein [Mycobacteriales bacterium]